MTLETGDRAAIRPAAFADVATVMTVMDAAFDPRFGEAWTASQLRSLFAMPGARLAMIEHDGRVAGFYAARVAGPESELLLVAVEPAARGLGLGRALLNDWINWAKSVSASEFFLEMRSDNPAIHLYRSQEFVECGHRPNYYSGADGEKRDAITMRKTI